MLERKEIVEKLEAELGRERFTHSLRAEKIALALAKKFGVGQKKASLAALLHDCARRYDRKELLQKARRLGLLIDPIRKFEPKLFHGEIGAWLARREFGVRSAGVLNAIRRHTTGAPGMTKLDKIIYLADHIEEGRAFTGVDKLRRLAFRDLDRAIYESASAMIRFLVKQGRPIYPPTVVTRNYYLPAGRRGSAKL
ncbi:MAG: bis(5'-nucleosyl)-tetraphosphatase (symmetrical) YqeK [Candidatus Saganbacteria bacterium]|nr:bis(5'-nucleosyl)-tetraphosphatase (symmetrical) YqeK [Candidatus Saganbacteria bacterium]